jgi:hypothetical protein
MINQTIGRRILEHGNVLESPAFWDVVMCSPVEVSKEHTASIFKEEKQGNSHKACDKDRQRETLNFNSCSQH